MVDGDTGVLSLSAAGDAGRDVAGGKARILGDLLAAGMPVPPGFVVTSAARGRDGLAALLCDRADHLGGDRFAVRSSAAAEDLPDASYAGLYDTFLNVDRSSLDVAVLRCFGSAHSARVAGYRSGTAPGQTAPAPGHTAPAPGQTAPAPGHTAPAPGQTAPAMAVLVQRMVDAAAAGVAFTAHPLSGDRRQVVVTAVPGLGEKLVSGEVAGAQWTVVDNRAELTRPAPEGGGVLAAAQAVGIAALARRVADRYGRPQDIEWAIDRAGKLWLLQARPMTALPAPASWPSPGPGLWMRNFRIGEWLPEAVTPLFATWLLPRLEQAYLDGMAGSIGVRVPFRYALVNGWYYTATPVPSPRLLARVIRRGRGRAVRILFHALVGVGRNPAAADRRALAALYQQWGAALARYREVVDTARTEVAGAPADRLMGLIDRVAHEAGIHLWFLAIVGGSAWKMEGALLRFCRAHLSVPLAGFDGGVQVLLRGLPGAAPVPPPPHAVQSMDPYRPVAAELPAPAASGSDLAQRHLQLAGDRVAAEVACRSALAGHPRLSARFDAMLAVTQRYAMIREEQARDLTLGWPVLRACALRLGQRLVADGLVGDADDVFFCTRAELEHSTSDDRGSLPGGDGAAEVDGGAFLGHDAPAPVAGKGALAVAVARRRRAWEQQRRLTAPLTIGRAPWPIGDVIDSAVRSARGGLPIPDGALVGHPASAGRATGPVRLVHDPGDFAAFRTGEVLVAKATAPAWTSLFARAAAVVTDGGTLAAHASLVAREYGIPAVVGTGDATSRLRTGQLVTVDGGAGTVLPLSR